VWPDGVVVPAPAFSQHTEFLHRVEEFQVEELIPEFRVEAFAIAFARIVNCTLIGECRRTFPGYSSFSSMAGTRV